MKILEVIFPDSVYTTKDGRRIDFKITENLEFHKNSDWIYHLIEAFIENEEVGFIRIAYIPKESVPDLYPSILNFIDKQGGHSLLPIDDPSMPYQSLSNEELYKLVKNGRWVLLQKQDSVPTDRSSLLILAKELEDWAKQSKYQKKFDKFLEYHVDKPEPDMIRINDDFKRQGIATSLYLFTARWLAQKNLQLWTASLQTGEAEKTWLSMVAKGYAKSVGTRYVIIV